MHHSVVTARRQGEVEAWTRLGWLVIGHYWDAQGAFTLLGLRIGRA